MGLTVGLRKELASPGLRLRRHPPDGVPVFDDLAGYPGQRPGANIHVVRDRTRGIAYLRTNPGQADVNNLDNLPRLTPGEWH